METRPIESVMIEKKQDGEIMRLQFRVFAGLLTVIMQTVYPQKDKHVDPFKVESVHLDWRDAAEILQVLRGEMNAMGCGDALGAFTLENKVGLDVYRVWVKTANERGSQMYIDTTDAVAIEAALSNVMHLLFFPKVG